MGKLQGTITSQLSVDFELDGKIQKLPMPALINLRSHPDEPTRRRGYEAENIAWEEVKETLAACMNGVKGEALTLNKKRRREDAVHAAARRGAVSDRVDAVAADVRPDDQAVAGDQFFQELFEHERATDFASATWGAGQAEALGGRDGCRHFGAVCGGRIGVFRRRRRQTRSQSRADSASTRPARPRTRLPGRHGARCSPDARAGW